MANNANLVTTQLVTKFAVKEFVNAMQMLTRVDRQLDPLFKKVGASIDVRRSIMWEATDGAVIASFDEAEEGLVSVTLDKRKKVAFKFTSEDLTLKIDDFNARYIKPAMIELAQKVENDLADTYKEVFNFVGTPGTEPANFLAVGAARAKLNKLGVPMGETKSAFYNPDAALQLANSLQNVFPQQIAKRAIEEAMITKYAQFEIFENQSLKTHTTGTYTTGSTPLINGAAQNVTYAASKDTGTQSLITDGWAFTTLALTEGDVFTIAGVNSVNRRSREDTGELAQFVVRADGTSDGAGNLTLTVAPPIITSGPYQTVTAAPADNAAITPVTGTEATGYVQNLAFHRNAITVAMAPLALPPGNVEASSESFEGISVRSVRDYDITNDDGLWRFDILYAVKVQNPGFAVRTTS